MLRLLASRRAFAFAAVAASVHEVRDKLPIYPSSQPDVVLIETPSELEKQIGIGRRALTGTYEDAHARIQSVISKWIGVEQAVEHRLKSLVAPDEPLTPGILYVGVATLTGSVFARNRLFWRLTLPPALFILSLNHFLPKTSANVSAYLTSLEEAHFPTFAEKHAIARAHSAMTWERVKDATQSGRDALSGGVESAVGKVEVATGLKLRETMGWKAQVTAEVRGAVKQVEDSVDAAKSVAEAKVEEAQEATERKVEDVKRLV